MLLLRRIQRPSRALAAPRLVRQQRHAPQQLPLFTQQQQQRLLWGRASDLMSWMGLKSDDDAKKTATQQPKDDEATGATDAPVAPPTRSKSSKRKAVRAAKAAAEAPAPPQPNEKHLSASTDASSSSSSTPPAPCVRAPATVSTHCGIQVTVDASSIRDVKRAMLALKRHVSAAASSSAPLALWDAMRSHAPITIADDGTARRYDASEVSAADDPQPQVVQLLPLATSVELLWRVQALEIGAPVSFLGATPELSNVLFVSEKTVLRQLLHAIAATKDKSVLGAAKALFEQYERDRAAHVDAIFDTLSAFDSVENPKPTRAQLDDWTRVSRDTYAAYIDVLAALGEHAQITAFFDDAAHRETFLGSPQTLRKALKACLAEHRGDLARRLIDDYARHFPWLVISKNAYQTALQACLRSSEAAKTPAQLANALYVYDRMAQDAGYIVYPNMWSMLFNTCIYLARHDDAVRVFESYKRQQIAPFEHRFTQTLRTACKLEQFDTAVAMVHAWVALERAAFDARVSKTSTAAGGSILDNQHSATQALASKAECECFNKILWEMLKRAPTLEQLAQVLHAMETRGAPAGAQVIRLLVARYLRDPSVSKSEHAISTAEAPQARVEHLLALWDAVPRVIEHNAFVVHLVLEHCIAAGWERECRFVIDAALAKQIALPMGSVVKLLEMYEQRGAFDAVAELGTALLRDVSDRERARLSQSFFETLLLSYLRAQAFDEVLALDKEFKLTARFPKSEVLAMLVKDAASA